MTITEEGVKLAKEQGLTLSIANTILSPGKFEGEHVSTLVFYQAYLDGDGEYLSDSEQAFDLTEEEASELGSTWMGGTSFILHFRDDGFVCGDIVTVPA